MSTPADELISYEEYSETLGQARRVRDEIFYMVVDYLIKSGMWKLEDRQKHFDELSALMDRCHRLVIDMEKYQRLN
jgi:hypothetical protein